MADPVTLSTGRRVVITADNYADMARENLAGYEARGVLVDAAAMLQAFYQLAGKATSYQTNASGAAVVPDVRENAITSLSRSIYQATPDGVREVWGDASDFVVGGARDAGEWVSDTASRARQLAGELLDTLPGALREANSTVRILAIAGAAAVVAAAGAYALYKFR